MTDVFKPVGRPSRGYQVAEFPYFETLAISAAVIFGLLLLFELVARIQKNNKSRDEARKLELAKLRQEEQWRERNLKDMLGQVSYSRQHTSKLLRDIPEVLALAEDHLSRAMQDYEERAFYPFWDQLEHAANSMHRYKEIVEDIERHSAQYRTLTEELQEPVPAFPVGSSIQVLILSARPTMERIDNLARAAHRDFEFATIYATRKTNTILVKGFENLSSALYDISNDLNAIGAKIDRGVSSIVNSQDRIHDALSDELGRANATLDEISATAKFQGESIISLNKKSSERERQMIDALDNIQRQRKPLPTAASDMKHFLNTQPLKK